MTPRKREGSNLERRERPRWCTSGVLAESKEPRLRVGAPCLPAFCRYFVRADERTRTADLLITSDRSGVAGVCTGLQIPHI